MQQDIIGELNKYPKGYWDFKGKTKTGIHSIGKYPATMVPDMQYELLNIIVKQIRDNNIKLLDPFCGSGTTLVIAQDLGIDSTGIDINPYATLLSYVKTNIYDRDKMLSAIDRIENNLNQEQNFKEHYFYNIEKWFRKDIIQSLSIIRQCIIAEEDVSIRKFFWICLSETIFKFSNDRTSTFKLHILPEEKINLIQDDCIEFFIGEVKENASLLNYEEKNRVKIIYGDCCEVMQYKLNEKFKIICTSPPYGDNSTTVTYGQASILGSIINVVEIQIVSSQHLFFCPERGENMIKPTEFVNYVDRLPDDCVESMTDGEVHFHLPHPGHITCPFCSSAHIGVHQYRPQVLRGIPGATKRYVYNRRRYRCHDCGKTFVEESPFLASFQRRIGNRLRQIRARKKLSQREVIESIGIPFHLYVKYEDDVEPEIPSTLVAMKIAECLGTDVLDIWGDQLK